jgi:hypothetical protein
MNKEKKKLSKSKEIIRELTRAEKVKEDMRYG